MDNNDLNRLKAITALDEATRVSSTFDILSDVDILKAFNLPTNIHDEEVYGNSLVGRLLSERNQRPSKSTWNAYFSLAKSEGLQAAHAAELYFHVKDRYPVRSHEEAPDTPDNMIGDAAGGFGLMGDDKDCDTG